MCVCVCVCVCVRVQVCVQVCCTCRIYNLFVNYGSVLLSVLMGRFARPVCQDQCGRLWSMSLNRHLQEHPRPKMEPALRPVSLSNLWGFGLMGKTTSAVFLSFIYSTGLPV